MNAGLFKYIAHFNHIEYGLSYISKMDQVGIVLICVIFKVSGHPNISAFLHYLFASKSFQINHIQSFKQSHVKTSSPQHISHYNLDHYNFIVNSCLFFLLWCIILSFKKLLENWPPLLNKD
jgi:hypothetical protein